MICLCLLTVLGCFPTDSDLFGKSQHPELNLHFLLAAWEGGPPVKNPMIYVNILTKVLFVLFAGKFGCQWGTWKVMSLINYPTPPTPEN